MSDRLYSNEDKIAINEAWHALKRLTESISDEEDTIDAAFKYESKRGICNAKALIIRSMMQSSNIKKYELFSYSKGIALCISLAWSLFRRVNSSYRKKKISEFKRLAKIAIQHHEDVIVKELDRVSSGI
jgi:hypothetical protein